MNPMIPSLDGILLFHYCEQIENAPLYNHCRFPYCIPRTERDVGHCNLLGDCFYSDRGVNGRKINNFLMIVKKSHTFMSI